MIRARRVRSGEIDLHVVEAGEPGRPPVLLLHGFPDCHQVYDRVLPDLATDHHVATFDLRGVARSSAPRMPSGYRMEALFPDVDAVATAVFGDGARPHLVGHDWGSVIAFSYLAEGPARARSFTSVSGPHVAVMWGSARRLIAARRPGPVLRQLLASWYVFALQVPLGPELVLGAIGPRMVREAMIAGGVPADDPALAFDRRYVRERTRHAIYLYRQNALSPPPHPRPGAIAVPLALVVPDRDPYVRPAAALEGIAAIAPDHTITRVDGGHWLPRTHPGVLARAVREHVRAVEARG